MAKILFDMTFALLGLMGLCPILSILALLIKREDGGTVFYRGVRVGRGGKLFRIYKFRTMVMDADKKGGASTPDDDPRITRIGSILRKHKMDELPQLINILRGEMSFVGPRPEVPRYVEMFSPEEKAILRVRPGITDWASIWNPDEGSVLAGSADPEKAYMEKIRPEKIRLQLKYIRERSFLKDLGIIFQTIGVIFKKPGDQDEESLKTVS